MPGDLVLLTAGDRVPADGRIIETHALEIDESVLTGESLAVAKSAEAIAHEAAPLSDRTGMTYANTVVTRGGGEFVVTATGMATKTGRIAEMIGASEESLTPLQLQLDRLGKRLAGVALGVVAVILGLAVVQGTPLEQAVLTAITLAVAAVP